MVVRATNGALDRQFRNRPSKHMRSILYLSVHRKPGTLHEGKRRLVARAFRRLSTALLPDRANLLLFGWASQVTFVGTGNLVESGSRLERLLPLTTETSPDMPGACQYSLVIYDPQSHTNMLSSLNLTIFWTAIVASVFGLLCFTFVLYDCLARQQNSMVVKAAARANAVISGLFPKQVRDRLLAEEAQELEGKKKKKTRTKKAPNFSAQSDDNNLQARLIGSSSEFPVENEPVDEKYKGNPIADLFPATTIMFADIAGFTAWSSQREPTQVFILLETVFQRFDEIAKKRGVFKVETVGDCYVAVAGLPGEP